LYGVFASDADHVAGKHARCSFAATTHSGSNRGSKNGVISMRFIAHVSFPVEKFNAALRDGSAAQKIARIPEDTKPEAAYLTSKDGKRGGFLIVNVSHTAEIRRLAEPWFLTFDAAVEFMPAMVPEDLQNTRLEEPSKKLG
jgi:hypothetical protein